MSAYLRCIGVLTVLAGLILTGEARAEKAGALVPARLVVEDNGKMFSVEAVDKAKKIISDSKGQVEREVHVETYPPFSDAAKKEFEVLKTAAEKEEFWKKWTNDKAAGDKGLLIAINRSPPHISVRPSDTLAPFFPADKQNEVRKRLQAKLQEAVEARKAGKPEAEQQKLRDEALISIMEYTAKNLPASFGERQIERKGGNVEDRRGDGGGGGRMTIGGWICLAVCVMLGIWLVMALVRAFAGGGGYGGGAYGGGGGFFPSLLGGLFGAAAGMWMYDHFFGGHSSSAYAGDSGGMGDGGGDYGGTEAVQDTGNFSEDNYSGGDLDGDPGGGDLGGGGDFGGGDFGGDF